MSDDFDKDEWGNIELPGLSDKELYGKNWNRARTEAEKERLRKISKARMSDPEYRKQWDVAQKKAVEKRNAENEEWRDNVKKATSQRMSDPAEIEKAANGVRAYYSTEEGKKDAQRRADKKKRDPKWQARHKATMKERHKDPEFKAALAKGIANRSEEWRQNVSKACKARAMPVITPYGEFEGINDAKRKGLVTIEGCMKRMPHLFYYKENGPGKPTYETVIVSDLGEFRDITRCFEAHREKGDPNASSLWSFKRKGDYKKVEMPCREWINRLKKNGTL